MTARNEKPSATESSTDTLICSLEVIANQINHGEPCDQLMAVALLEAAARLDRLEKELGYAREAARSEAQFADELNEKLNAQQFKTLRDEFAMRYMTNDADEWESLDRLAARAYKFADAMMEARK